MFVNPHKRYEQRGAANTLNTLILHLVSFRRHKLTDDNKAIIVHLFWSVLYILPYTVCPCLEFSILIIDTTPHSYYSLLIQHISSEPKPERKNCRSVTKADTQRSFSTEACIIDGLLYCTQCVLSIFLAGTNYTS